MGEKEHRYASHYFIILRGPNLSVESTLLEGAGFIQGHSAGQDRAVPGEEVVPIQARGSSLCPQEAREGTAPKGKGSNIWQRGRGHLLPQQASPSPQNLSHQPWLSGKLQGATPESAWVARLQMPTEGTGLALRGKEGGCAHPPTSQPCHLREHCAIAGNTTEHEFTTQH